MGSACTTMLDKLPKIISIEAPPNKPECIKASQMFSINYELDYGGRRSGNSLGASFSPLAGL